MHQVDAHAVAAQLLGQVLGQVGQAGVAHAGAQIALRPPGRQPANVDDAAPALPLHIGRHGAGAAQVAHHLGVQIQQHVLIADFGQGAPGQAAGGGGVVHQDVNAPAQGIGGGRHHRVDLLGAGHIGHDGRNRPARGAGDILGGGGQGIGVAPGDDHGAAFGRQRARHRLADAAAAAGNDGRFAVQFQIHSGCVSLPFQAGPIIHRPPPAGYAAALS